MLTFLQQLFPGKSRQARRRRGTQNVVAETLEIRKVPTTMTAAAIASEATAWSQVVHTNVAQLVHDAAVIEVNRPTLAANTLANDIVKLNYDNTHGANVFQLYSDLTTMEKHMIAEGNIAQAYHLSPAASLENYTAISHDMLTLRADGVDIQNFINSVIHQYTKPAPTTSPAPFSWLIGSDLANMIYKGGHQVIPNSFYAGV